MVILLMRTFRRGQTTRRLVSKIGAPFEKEERYQQLIRRQGEIEKQLDLTKNQAPNQAEVAPLDDNELKTGADQTTQKTGHSTRRALVRV